MRFRKSIVSIGNNPCTVVQFNYNPPKDKKISVNRMHFIQILDRSGSMAPHIDELVENVKKTIKVMDAGDLLSVIWFSGPGQCKVLLRGASISEPGLKNQLDKLKSTLGTTCFSEAVMEAKEVAEDLAELCPNFVVSLFTDGEPMVPWTVQEEQKRTKNILAQFSDKILSFNTIGYGGGYNINFLKELAALSKFGRYAHSTRIDEYLSIFTHNFRAVENISPVTIDINCAGKSILYLTRRNSRLDNDALKINLSSKSANKFYIISNSEEEFQFQVNDETYNSQNIKTALSQKDTDNLLYTLAYEQYYRGNSSEGMVILTTPLRDKYLVKSVLHAFTSRERQGCTELLLRAAHNRKVKLQPKVWKKARMLEGELSEGELIKSGPCFMDLLALFEKNGDMFIPIASEKYRRIGRKVTDNYNAFRSDKAAKLTASFKNLVFNKEKLNVSIRYEIPGFVTINPRQAKAAGFKTNVFNAKVFREQTIIKDGDVNIEKFQVLASENTLKYLQKLKVKGLVTKAKNNQYENEGFTLIQLDASKLPIINGNYVSKSDSLDYILDICYEQRAAECRQKVIKYYLERESRNNKYGSLRYTREQSELLKSFGLDSGGIYQGIDNKASSEVQDQYECRFFEFGLKGFSTLPKVEDVLKKMENSSRKFNGPEKLMADYITFLNQRGYTCMADALNKLLEEKKATIRTNTRILAQIKLAKTLTGSWWQGLKADSRDNYLYEKEGKTLVIKVVKKVVQI